MEAKKELKVSAIKSGTVIDHIPAENLFKVISILSLDETDHQVTFGTNLESKRLGKKAIIKVSERFFKDKEINKIIAQQDDKPVDTRDLVLMNMAIEDENKQT